MHALRKIYASVGIRQILIFSTFRTIRQIFCPPNFPSIQYLQQPTFKYLSPPQFAQLKTIVLENYHKIQHLVHCPLFLNLGHNICIELTI